MPRTRLPKETTKMISVNSTGRITNIDKTNCVIPNKNEYVIRDKVSHDPVKRKQFQEISTVVTNKVENYKAMQLRLKKLEKSDHKFFMGNIDRMFNKALNKAEDVNPQVSVHSERLVLI